MTIALGMLARDGIVMAADTQESAGYWKRDHGKIVALGHRASRGRRGRRWNHCLISGAGSGPHIDGLSKLLQEAFESRPANVEAALRSIVQRFYVDQMLPFAAYPLNERPDISLLVACDYRRKTSLWTSQENMFNAAGVYDAVGIGADMALTILGRCYRLPILDVPHSVLLAAYVMAQVKDSIEGCGKATDIYYVRRNASGYVPRQHTEELERAMGSYVSYAEPWALREIIGESWPDGRVLATRSRETVRRLLTRLRADEQNALLR
jgi:hypothetical protein